MNGPVNEQFFNDLGFFTLSNAAPELGKFFRTLITISSPKTELMSYGTFVKKMNGAVYATIKFNGGQLGETHVFFGRDDALKLAEYAVSKKIRKDVSDLMWDELSKNAIEEIINILGGNMTEIFSVVYGKNVEIDVPELKELLGESNLLDSEEKVVLNTFNLYLGEDENIVIYEMAKQSYFEEIVSELKKRL